VRLISPNQPGDNGFLFLAAFASNRQLAVAQFGAHDVAAVSHRFFESE
jgi:hypothetical protein